MKNVIKRNWRILTLWAFVLAGLYLAGAQSVYAFNPITDVLQNTTFPIGQVASAGTAVNLKNGDLETTMLAEVADYRGMLALSYGGAIDNQTGGQFTDAVKIGFELNWILAKFTNPLPPQASFLKNINFGPGYQVSAITHPGLGYPFFDINYSFK